MLKEIKSIIKGRYYDKNFRGIDVDQKFDEAAEKIKKLEANWQIFRVIAQVVLEFNDSHTRFYPPGRANRVEYGFTLQMIGDRCFVTDVKKGSDAEAKGLKPGDQVSGIEQYNPTRENLWKINYILYSLDPQEQISLFLLNTDGTSEREVKIKASFKSIKEREKERRERRNKKKESPYRCKKINAELIACRLETFSVEKKDINRMMKEVGGHKKLILDLRGNRGGYVSIEEYLTGYFFDRNVKIADFIMRDKTKERVAKTQKEDAFQGEMIVLIDSNSASAAEVFSRVIQLEKRGKIIGDISAGAVMTSIQVSMTNVRGPQGFETYSVFGMNVTIADLIMSDGNRLENVGVTPDIAIGPSGAALAQGNDPILAYAAKLFGAELSNEEAGSFHFLTPEPEDLDDEQQDNDEENRMPPR
ncbi:MAG: S41 family peptidase [Pyrinomonadaceae bacterium]